MEKRTQELYKLLKFDLLHRSQEKQGTKSKGLQVTVGKENEQTPAVLGHKASESESRLSI
jgi:hypothetical protein